MAPKRVLAATSTGPLKDLYNKRQHGRGMLNAARLKKMIPLLKAVHKRRRGVNVLLNNPDRDVVNVFCECALNTLKGNIPLSPCQFKRLQRYKQHLRKLADRKVSQKTKRNIIKKQKGGFLPLLAGALLPVLGPLIGGLFK